MNSWDKLKTIRMWMRQAIDIKLISEFEEEKQNNIEI